MQNDTLYFDYEKDNLADKFPGLKIEEIEKIGIIKCVYTHQDNQNISEWEIRNVTIKEAIEMGIIDEDYVS